MLPDTAPNAINQSRKAVASSRKPQRNFNNMCTWMILAAPEKQQPKQSWLYTNHIDALSSRKLTCRSKRGLPIRRNWVDQSIGNGERFTDVYQRWHKQTDKFTFKKNEFNELRILTERRCLGLIGQLWDPIGPCVARSNQAQNRPKRIVELRL